MKKSKELFEKFLEVYVVELAKEEVAQGHTCKEDLSDFLWLLQENFETEIEKAIDKYKNEFYKEYCKYNNLPNQLEVPISEFGTNFTPQELENRIIEYINENYGLECGTLEYRIDIEKKLVYLTMSDWEIQAW